MSPLDDHSRTLLDEVAALVELRADNTDEVNESLKSILNKFSITPHSDSVGEALQLLGTAVGKRSNNLSSGQKISLTVNRNMAGPFPRNRVT